MKKKISPSAQYRVTLRLEYPHAAGWIAKVSGLIARHGGVIVSIDLLSIRSGMSLREFRIECSSTEHAEKLIRAIRELDGVTVHAVTDDTFELHRGGKIAIAPKVPIRSRSDLSMAYTPGVARICETIHAEPRTAFNLTIRKNCIAVVTDGSAVLGLGNIGPAAAMPVMEGKAVLFKEFAGVDAFPICVATQDVEEIIALVRNIAPSFGGINLEDISAPRCFEIEQRLKRELDIPVFHDDQHGTAIVVLAGFINALRVTGKKARDIKVVVAGAGAAGIATARMLHDHGVRNQIICDSHGAIDASRDVGGNPAKAWAIEHTNPDGERGPLKKVIAGADMFIGLSAPRILGRADVRRMARDPVVFAMSNPVPEVMPEDIGDVVSVLATGRSDYPNQINNVLAFPGIFRGALDACASDINDTMMHVAAEAIAESVDEDELCAQCIIPSVFDPRVAKSVAVAVTRAARRTRVARRMPTGIGGYPT